VKNKGKEIHTGQVLSVLETCGESKRLVLGDSLESELVRKKAERIATEKPDNRYSTYPFVAINEKRTEQNGPKRPNSRSRRARRAVPSFFKTK